MVLAHERKPIQASGHHNLPTADAGQHAHTYLPLRMSEPFVYPGHNVIDLLLYRGRAVDVDTVMVGGEVLFYQGKHTRIDRQEVIHKLRESISDQYAEQFEAGNRMFPALQERIAAYFAPWYEELDAIEKKPYYFMNNRS